MDALFPPQQLPPTYPAKEYVWSDDHFDVLKSLNTPNRMQDWMALGNRFGYETTKLIEINRQCPDNPVKQLLLDWFESNDEQATNQVLKDALVVIGRNSIVTALGLDGSPTPKPPPLNPHFHISKYMWKENVRRDYQYSQGGVIKLLDWHKLDDKLGRVGGWSDAFALGKALGYTHLELYENEFVGRHMGGGWSGTVYYTMSYKMEKLLQNWSLGPENTLYMVLDALNKIGRGDLIKELGLEESFGKPLNAQRPDQEPLPDYVSKYNFDKLNERMAKDMFDTVSNYDALNAITDWKAIGKTLGYYDEQMDRFEMMSSHYSNMPIRHMMKDWIEAYESAPVRRLLEVLEFHDHTAVIDVWGFDALLI